MENFNFIKLQFDNSKPPEFKVVKNQDWVEFGDERPYKNRYPDYIENLFDRANKHSAFIRSKIYYICGNGVTINKTGLTVGDASVMIDELKAVNEFGETIGDILEKVVCDFEKHNGAYLEVNWWRNGKGFDVTHIPFKSLRIAPDKKSYYYSRDWSKPKSDQTFEKTGFINIPIYNETNTKGKQIYALKEYSNDSEYYPKPPYMAAVPSAETEYEIANYHLQSVKSGFHIGTIISFVGNPTDQEKDKLETDLKEKFEGTDKAGSLLLQFTRNKDEKPEITRIAPDELDKKFDTLTKTIEQELTAGHHMMPILAGIKTEGQLGGRSEIDVAYEVFDKTYVRARQNKIEKWINKLYEKYGFQGRIKFKHVSPISPFDYKDIMNYMDENEIRELAGLEPRKKITPLAPQKMSSDKTKIDDIIISEFEKCGESDEQYTVVEEIPLSFAKDVSEFDKSVLAILDKDPLATDEAISQALKCDVKKVSDSITRLEDAEYISTKEKNQTGVDVRKVKVSEEGKSLAEESKKMDGKTIMYKYEWRSEIPEGERNTVAHPSRQFCVKLMSASKTKFFSRADIDRISATVGTNVFEFRGGWWNDDGVNKPSCRHVWKSYLVTRK